MELLLIVWNVTWAAMLCWEALQFDRYHFRRLRWKMFSLRAEKWQFGEDERRSLRRFALWLAIGLAGNALIQAARLIMDMTGG